MPCATGEGLWLRVSTKYAPRFKEFLIMKSPMFLGLTLVILALPVTIANAIANKPKQPTPAETQGNQAIVWERSGGIAGICQRLTLRSSAAYVLEDCRKQTVVVSRGSLPEGDRVRFKKLLQQQYGSFQWKSSHQGADVFSDRYTLNGRGVQKPTLTEQAALNQDLAQLAGKLAQRSQSLPLVLPRTTQN